MTGRPTAVVMNMFYTGLGVARSLGEQGIPVIGLTSQRRIYGNFSRYARTMFCPDSKTAPDALLTWLLDLGAKLGDRSILFPTRDDDVVFLDRFRDKLEPHFVLAVARRPALAASLDKWETFVKAQEAKVPAPKCWLIEDEQQLKAVLCQITYPCVLKPVAAHHWRAARNWEIVGARKAIGVSSESELLSEYATAAKANSRVLVQEMVPGGDDALAIAACYMDRSGNCLAAFNAQKLVQVPAGYGTGCIVQTVDRPELIEPTIRLLRHIGFSGIAEVEYKWDTAAGEYKLIEINPRPWDQHRLGNACGVDLISVAYHDYAGLPQPAIRKRSETQKWIAEDAFVTQALRLAWRRDPELRPLFQMARGKRIYAIWSATDPLPLLVYTMTNFIPRFVADTIRFASSAVRRRKAPSQKDMTYGTHLDKSKGHA